MMHVTAYYRSPSEPNWRAVAYGVGSNLRWAAGACFVSTYGPGITWEEVKADDPPKGTYDMEGRVTRKDGDKVVAEWRIVPSPGSRPDANAPPFVPQVQRVSPAQRALQNGKAKKPAVAAQQAARGPSPGTVVAKAQTPNPPPSGPTLARRPMTRRPLTTTKSLDDAKPAPVDVTRRLIQRRPLKRRA